MLPSVAAVAVAWCAGAGVTGWLWPRDLPLPRLAHLGLAGLLGPVVTGAAFMAMGLAGLGPLAIPLVTVAAVLMLAAGMRSRRQAPRAGPLARSAALAGAVVLCVGWTTSLAMRTHLGWDGTVVWYHKARILAANHGMMPANTLADRTRAWTAPDYPLHVPLAMAWVRAWQPVEDERAAKTLPAAWCAAVICLLAAATRERARPRRAGDLRAVGAVLILATSPRLLVGEGSLTSGYADGPLAGLLLALVWIAWRSGWAAERAWQPMLAVIAAGLAWTKQEGVVTAVVVAAACAWSAGELRRAIFAVPAVVLGLGWHAWAVAGGAPASMAYAWPGLAEALGRMPLVVRAYSMEMADVRSWGLFWPLAGLGLCVRRSRAVAVLVAVGGVGAAAFLWSGWPDVREHLVVTTPRLLLQIAPAAVFVLLSEDFHAVADKNHPRA